VSHEHQDTAAIQERLMVYLQVDSSICRQARRRLRLISGRLPGPGRSREEAAPTQVMRTRTKVAAAAAAAARRRMVRARWGQGQGVYDGTRSVSCAWTPCAHTSSGRAGMCVRSRSARERLSRRPSGAQSVVQPLRRHSALSSNAVAKAGWWILKQTAGWEHKLCHGGMSRDVAVGSGRFDRKGPGSRVYLFTTL